MEEQINSSDREQCSYPCNISADGTSLSASVSLSGALLPEERTSATVAESSTSGQRGCILRSLLSRPADEMNSEDSRDCGQCWTLREGVGHRPRSRSMGTKWWTIPEVASPASQDSLEYAGESQSLGSGVETGSLGLTAESLHTDQLIEVARCKLMTLRASEDYFSSYKSRLCTSQPGSPPRTDTWTSEKLRQHRKYSEGSRLKACLQGLRTGFRTPDISSEQLHPIDFSLCRRRKKFEGISGLPYARHHSGYQASNTSTDEGLGDDCSSEQSILKSILTGRSRSNTISTCGSRSRYDALGNSTEQSLRFARQPVALAKKNLHPVMAKINDCVNQVVAFIRSVPEIAALSGADQRSVISASLHRLLLLFMAESNIHFVVAPVLHSADIDKSAESRQEQATLGQGPTTATSVGSGTAVDAEFPTLQFAESVKSFVSKCQALNISTEEYRLMKLIALFQSAGGLGSLEVAAMSDEACCAARRDLQQLLERTTSCASSSEHVHQRYSSLLLTIYTLSGIHCGMLDTLFCRPTMTPTPPT